MKNKEYILITGSTGKLGKTICEVFAEMGNNIIMHYFNSDKKLNLMVNDIRKRFPKISIIKIKIDLSNLYSVNHFNNKIFNKFRIKGLVNNASFFIKDEKDINTKFLDKNLNIHFRNPVTLISCMINSDISNKFAVTLSDEKNSQTFSGSSVKYIWSVKLVLCKSGSSSHISFDILTNNPK